MDIKNGTARHRDAPNRFLLTAAGRHTNVFKGKAKEKFGGSCEPEPGKTVSIAECQHGVKRQIALPLAQAVPSQQPLGGQCWRGTAAGPQSWMKEP